MTEFKEWPKLSRFFDSKIVVSEKIDGTNGILCIHEDPAWSESDAENTRLTLSVGSRTRWITPDDDNYGFAKWAHDNKEELIKILGEGYHYGEWWGQGVQRRYDMDRKVFSLFNVHRWGELWHTQGLLDVVPYRTYQLSDVVSKDAEAGTVTFDSFDHILEDASEYFMGTVSRAAAKYGKKFSNTEGFVLYHDRSKQLFKFPLNK